MIKFGESAHFYTPEGEPRYEAGLKEARIDGLYVSPTTVLKGAVPNVAIERYALNQLAKAAFDNPPWPTESQEDYANRIYEASSQHRQEAADFGTALHDAAEHWPQLPLDPILSTYAEEFGGWYDENILERIAAEVVVVDHDIGVAGKLDFKGRHKDYGLVLCDYKTQGIKRDKSGRKVPGFYDTWPMQLAFYAVADAKASGMFPALPTCVSVVIDSNEPDKPFVKAWSPERIALAYRQFVCATWMWCAGKGKGGYWPGRMGQWRLDSEVIPMLD